MFVLGWLLPRCCCLLVVSCQSLSVVGRRLPFVGSFLLHRSLPVDICRIFLALPSRQSPTAPARLGFGQSMYIQVHSLYTHRTCVCPAHLLFLREILHMQPRNCATVQLCNCSTVQLFNCPTCRALSGMKGKSYDFRCCRDVVNASPASVASLAFSAASASAARKHATVTE